ncbi:MAG: DUF805 domain-containing protein [Sphingomonas sp.]
MHWMLMPLRRYAQFEGRSRRKEFWMWVLFTSIVSTLFALLGLWGAESRLFSSEDELMLYFICTLGLFSVVIFIPNLAVVVRRLHDTDRSGWNILWGFVPLVGGFILLYFYVLEGTRGPNRFGPDPKGADPGTFA